MKRYYKVREVAKIVGILPHTLRYWESEFGKLHHKRSNSGERLYTQKKIDLIKRIYGMRYDQFIGIKGIKKLLEL